MNTDYTVTNGTKQRKVRYKKMKKKKKKKTHKKGCTCRPCMEGKYGEIF